MLGGITDIHFLGEINMATWPSRLGSLKFEKIKFGHESTRTRARERLRWRGPAAIENYKSVLTSERAFHNNKSINV
jgi:hypothetical protein